MRVSKNNNKETNNKNTSGIHTPAVPLVVGTDAQATPKPWRAFVASISHSSALSFRLRR